MKKLRIAFDIIDENGEKLPQDIANTIEIELAEDNISHADIFALSSHLDIFANKLPISGGISHLFFQTPGTDKLGENYIPNRKQAVRNFAYWSYQSEIVKLHNNPVAKV